MLFQSGGLQSQKWTQRVGAQRYRSALGDDEIEVGGMVQLGEHLLELAGLPCDAGEDDAGVVRLHPHGD